MTENWLQTVGYRRKKVVDAKKVAFCIGMAKAGKV